VPAMPPGGAIVAVSSTAVVTSARGLASHKAGKAAVDALVEAAADELGEEGIRVNSVRAGVTGATGPGGVEVDDETAELVRAGQPLTRSGDVDDIAQAIRFLAGPESSWVTGQHLTVDGGHVLRAFPDLRPPPAGGEVSLDLSDEGLDLGPVSAPEVAPAPTA
jgi:NAD(P)-dependent dehydrogenase (short-subunit alcohol dehydrogenase family)